MCAGSTYLMLESEIEVGLELARCIQAATLLAYHETTWFTPAGFIHVLPLPLEMPL